MVQNYKHHLYPKQSEFVKYRGKTGQIDVKDTIIAILAHKPGLTHDELKDMIYHPDFNKSRFYNVSSAIDALAFDGTIFKEEVSGQFYLQNDAISHDIAKTQASMDKLTELGLTKEQVVFLSSGIIMAGESYSAEHDGHNHNVNDTVASSPAIVPPVKVEVEEPVQELINEHIVDFDGVKMVEVEPGVHEPIEDDTKIMLVPGVHIPENDPVTYVTIPNPFENMSAEDIDAIKVKALEDIHAEAEAEAHEKARLQMEAEEAKAEIALAEKIAKEASDKLNIELAYKNKLNNIKSATSLLGLDVEIKLPDLTSQVVGTILELRPDSVLFLIVFSKEDLYPEGSVHTIFYKDSLSYKIMA